MKTHDEKEIIRGVHHKEVGDFLESIGRLEKSEGEIVCHICGTKITSENLRAVTRKSGKLLFCCDNPECYKALTETLRE